MQSFATIVFRSVHNYYILFVTVWLLICSNIIVIQLFVYICINMILLINKLISNYKYIIKSISFSFVQILDDEKKNSPRQCWVGSWTKFIDYICNFISITVPLFKIYLWIISYDIKNISGEIFEGQYINHRFWSKILKHLICHISISWHAKMKDLCCSVCSNVSVKSRLIN